MDKSNAQNNKLTPRRTLGLSRRSPSNPSQTLPTLKRSAETEQQPSTSKTETVNDNNSTFKTPVKYKRLNVSRTIFTPEAPTVEKPSDAEKSVEEIEAEIKEMKEHVAEYEKYKKQKEELTNLIQVWREGGREALKRLQEAIKPEQEFEAILKHLKLPEDVFD